MPKQQRRHFSLTSLAEKMAKERGIEYETPQKMSKELFDVLLKEGELATILYEGGEDLTPTQLKKVKEAARKQTKEQIESMALDLAMSPGYQAFVTMPLVKKILGETASPKQKTEEKPQEQKPVITPGPAEDKKKSKKSKKKDPEVNTVSPKIIVPLKQNDSEADIFAKIYNLMEVEYKEDHEELEKNKKLKLKEQQKKEDRTKKIVELFGGKYEKKKYIEEKKENWWNKFIKLFLVAGGLATLSTATMASDLLPEVPKFTDFFEDVVRGILDKMKDTFASVTGSISSGFKSLIGRGESVKGEYNQLVFPGKNAEPIQMPKKLTDMTLGEVYQLQDKMKAAGYPSTAVGKYQIIKGTLKEHADRLGFDDSVLFDEKTQDMLLESLLNKRGLQQFKRGRLSKEDFQTSLAQEWASIPVPRDMHVDDKYGSRDLKAGESYYKGINGNKASPAISQDMLDQLLNKVRAEGEEELAIPAAVPVPDKMGSADAKLQENTSMMDIPARVSSSTLNNTTNVFTGDTNYLVTTPIQSDKPIFMVKQYG